MTRARDVANVLSTATSLATDTETAAAISSHNTAANGHVGRGTTANRPGSPATGDLYYDTTINNLIRYNGTSWVEISPIPNAPTSVSATAGDALATVSFTAPTNTLVSSYTATSSPGSITGSSTSSPITVSGLTNNTAYTFTVTATNVNGTSSASSASNSVTPAVLGAFESIATASGTGSSGTITFSNIPGTYRHLQIRYLGQTTRGTYAQDALGLRLNGDSGSTYSRHLYRLNEVSTTGIVKLEQGNQAEINFDYGTLGAAGGSANFWAVGVIDILDYKDTNKHKTVKMIAGTDSNGTVGGVYSVVGMYEGTWRNTNAITSIDFITPATGANFVSGTKFYLYGIRG